MQDVHRAAAASKPGGQWLWHPQLYGQLRPSPGSVHDPWGQHLPPEQNPFARQVHPDTDLQLLAGLADSEGETIFMLNRVRYEVYF